MGFPELRRQCGISHEVRQGAQGASRVAPGKSGLHVHGQGSQVSMCMARGSWSSLSSHGKRLCPQEALKKDSRGLSWVAAGKPRFPRLLLGT